MVSNSNRMFGVLCGVFARFCLSGVLTAYDGRLPDLSYRNLWGSSLRPPLPGIPNSVLMM